MTSPLFSSSVSRIQVLLSQAAGIGSFVPPVSSLSKRTLDFAIPLFQERADAAKERTDVAKRKVEIESLAVNSIQDELNGHKTKLDELTAKVTECKARIGLRTQELEMYNQNIERATRDRKDLLKKLSTYEVDLQVLLADTGPASISSSSSSSKRPNSEALSEAPVTKKTKKTDDGPTDMDASPSLSVDEAQLLPRRGPSGIIELAGSAARAALSHDFSLIREIYKDMTPVYYKGEKAEIRGYDKETDKYIVGFEDKVETVTALQLELSYRAKKGEEILIQDSKDNCGRYYKAIVIHPKRRQNPSKPPQIAIRWKDFGGHRRPSERGVFSLSTILPVQHDDPLLQDLESVTVTTVEDPSVRAEGYYLKKKVSNGS